LKKLPSKENGKFFYLSLEKDSATQNYFAKMELGGKNQTLVPSLQTTFTVMIDGACKDCIKSGNNYDHKT